MCGIKAKKTDETTVTIEGFCSEKDYKDVYWTIQKMLRCCKDMKTKVVKEEYTPTKIIKALSFLSEKSADTFIERLLQRQY